MAVLSILLATPVKAQCTPDPAVTGGTTTCRGVDADGLAVTARNVTVNVAPGALVTSATRPALSIDVPASFFSNSHTVNVSGQIFGDGTAGIALYNGATGSFISSVTANLQLTVAAGGSVGGTNALVLAQSSGNNFGDTIARIDNSGTLSGTSGIALQAALSARGTFASIVNRRGGTIGAIAGFVAQLTNDGLIDGGSNSAVDMGAGFAIRSGAWTNTGTITSAAATATLRNLSGAFSNEPIVNGGIISNSGAGAALSGSNYAVVNQAGGRITAVGGPAISSTDGLTLTNAGTIVGDVLFTSTSQFGGATIDTAAGTIAGNVSLGIGNDVVVARYTGVPTLVTGISGTLSGGGGTNSIRIQAPQDLVINTPLQLPTGFQRLQLAPATGATITLASGFQAPGTIELVNDPRLGATAGAVVNRAELTFDGQAIVTGFGSGVLSFSNEGSIRATGNVTDQPSLALDGVNGRFLNSGVIDVVGDGLRTSFYGTTLNTGTIVATGTAVRAFGNQVTNRGLIRSTGGTGLVVSGSFGTEATNSGRIEGLIAGARTGTSLVNSGTIVATSAGGTAVVLDAYGTLVNLAGGVVGNGNAAITAFVFNSTVVNAGTINGSVALGSFSGSSGHRYISLPGATLNGDLTLAPGSTLFTDFENRGAGSFAGITGTVRAGAGSSLIYRVSANAAASLGPVGPFQSVSYELANGAALSLNAGTARTQTVQLAGTGTVSLDAPITVTSAPAIATAQTFFYPGGPAAAASQLAITSAGTISLVRAANSFPLGAVVLGSEDRFTNLGTITVVDRQTSFTPVVAISGGALVSNEGGIRLDGVTGVSGATRVVNGGSIVQVAGGGTARGIIDARIVENRGTIDVAGTAVQLGSAFFVSGAAPSLSNSGTLVSRGGAAVTSFTAATLDNSGIIAGGVGVAVQLGFGNDAVTLRTGSDVRGVIDGGSGTNTATLIGSVPTATSSQTVAAFSRFNTLAVASGYWTAPAGSGGSFAGGVTIAAGATLDDANGASGLAGAVAPTITNDGTLVVRSSAASAGSTFAATRVTGRGSVLLTGAGTVLLDGVNRLAHAGGTTIGDGTTVVLTGTQGGAFATAPGGTLQIGNGTAAGNFTGTLAVDGSLVLNRADDYALGGAIGGAGRITKLGAGKVTLAGSYAFSGIVDIRGGAIGLAAPAAATTRIALEGTGRFDLAGLNQTVAGLAGSSALASISIAGGSLTVNQADDTSFAGRITGNGTVTKSGAGRLLLTGSHDYTGTTTVAGGTLAVNGSLVSPVTVAAGGTLGGTGTVGSVLVASGGTYAPGNSIGTQTVAGNLTFAPGASYLVEVNAAGQSDRIVATGRATLAGTVAVRGDNRGTYANLTSYSILTAAGGVSGQFDGVTSDLAFLTPYLLQEANGVTLLLGRNDVSFAAIAVDRNQASVAAALQPLGLGNPLYRAVLGQSAAGARAAFSSLSGEIHAALPTVLLLQSQQAARAVARHVSDSDDGVSVWAEALFDRVEGRVGSGVAQLLGDQQGGMAGITVGRDGLRAGVAGGYVDGDVGLVGRASHADIRSKLAAGYVGWGADALRIGGGVAYSWHDIRSRRTVAVGQLGGLQTARPDANVLQVYGDISYAVAIGDASIAPFAGIAYLRSHRDGFRESGTSVALTVARSHRSVEVTTAGVRLSGRIELGGSSLLPHLAVSYQRNWGNVAGIERASVAASTATFGIVGMGLGRNAGRVAGGLDWQLGQAWRIGTDVFGEAGSGYGQFGARGALSYRF